MTTASAAPSKILLVPDRVATADPAVKIRRYRFARLRVDQMPPGPGRRDARRRSDD